jgi:hypothetical protein
VDLRRAPEHSGQQGHRINTERASDRNELRDIDTTFERFDSLDPVGGDLKLSGQLPLGELSVPASRCDGRRNGPMATGILHAGALDPGMGASITVALGLIRN